MFYTIGAGRIKKPGHRAAALRLPPRRSARVPLCARELPCLRAQGDRRERGADAGAAGLHAPDVARTAVAVQTMWKKGQGFARGGISAAGGAPSELSSAPLYAKSTTAGRPLSSAILPFPWRTRKLVNPRISMSEHKYHVDQAVDFFPEQFRQSHRFPEPSSRAISIGAPGKQMRP